VTESLPADVGGLLVCNDDGFSDELES